MAALGGALLGAREEVFSGKLNAFLLRRREHRGDVLERDHSTRAAGFLRAHPIGNARAMNAGNPGHRIWAAKVSDDGLSWFHAA